MVIYGVDECPQNTSCNVHLQKDTDALTKLFASIEVTVEPRLILNCYRLAILKSQNQDLL